MSRSSPHSPRTDAETFVIDASALVSAFARKDDGGAALRRRLVAARCHAPHLVDAEVGNALRGLERAGTLDPDESFLALRGAAALIDRRYQHRGPLARRAWDLRDNLSFYDALYVVLAAKLGLTLLSADASIARTPRLPCSVELV